MKNSNTTNKYPLPKDKIWTRLPDRVQALEEAELPIPPYKVYTALLTQSGRDGITNINGGDLIIGVTYQIFDNAGSGWDFTNVGAPNNDIGASFVATGITPNSWGIDGLLEYNTGAPVVTVLENTIGNIWFTYDGVGLYRLSSEGLFIEGKTWCMTAIVLYGELFNEGNMEQVDVNRYRIITSQNAISAEDLLANTPIEIRVYN